MKGNWIPRNEQGTRATLQTIRSMAVLRDGLDWTQWLPGIDSPLAIAAFLSKRWFYVPDGKTETVRTVVRMAWDFTRDILEYVDGVEFGWKPVGYFAGDCDDAALMALAIITRLPVVSLVAVRPPDSSSFDHVFVEVVRNGVTFHIDPTAPLDADYMHWERMIERVF